MKRYNIFNTFLILGSAAIVSPIPLPSGATIDLLINLGIVVALFLFTLLGRGQRIERWEGMVLLSLFTSYEFYLPV